MSVQIDGKTLNATVELRINPVYTEFDEYTAEGYRRRIALFGAYRTWRIDGVEDVSVSWDNSIVKYLYDKAANSQTVTLTINTEIYGFTGKVFIKDISVQFENRGRIYSITLQEAF